MNRRLRIAVFVHEFPALSETFVLNQVTGLMDLGHEVTVLAVAPRQESRVHADVERYDLSERVRYPALPASHLRRIFRAGLLFLRHGWRRGRVLLRCLDVRRYGRDATSLRLFFWAVRLAGEAPFDIIHCHFGPVGQLAAKLRDAGVLAGRLVTVFHGVDVSAYVRDQPDYYRFLFARGELFLPISRAWGQKLVELGCDPGRIQVHRMGVDVGRYPFHIRRFHPDRPLRVLTVGRMVEKKGIEYALRAVAEVVHKGFPVEYDVVGDGPLRDHLEGLAGALGLASSVIFHGWQEQGAVSTLMNDGDVLLAPSVTSADGDQEGIPVTLMEAMATGMVVISTFHSGIPELVEHEQSGLLVPERDVGALAQALMHLTRSPDAWSSMSQAARRRVMADFEVGRLNADLVRHFEALLGLSHQPPGADVEPIARKHVPVCQESGSQIDHQRSPAASGIG
jgi:colanic acid/amylovoran biosynthesis glycosyltransferase